MVSLKITNNWIHNNTDAGLQVDATPTGVITINGNLFKANGGPGVTYGGGGSLNATYNSWGDLAGPTGVERRRSRRRCDLHPVDLQRAVHGCRSADQCADPQRA